MKVIVTYTVHKKVEIEIDSRFADLLEPSIGYRYNLALSQDLKNTVWRKVTDENMRDLVEIVTAEEEECLWEW